MTFRAVGMQVDNEELYIEINHQMDLSGNANFAKMIAILSRYIVRVTNDYSCFYIYYYPNFMDDYYKPNEAHNFRVRGDLEEKLITYVTDKLKLKIEIGSLKSDDSLKRKFQTIHTMKIRWDKKNENLTSIREDIFRD